MPSARSALGKAVKPFLRRFGYTVAYDDDYEPEAQTIMNAAAPHTMTTRPRIYSLWQAVRYVVQADIPGDFVECGVWRGGSMYAAALTLNSLQVSDRGLVLCDTFEGMTAPTTVDINTVGHDAAELMRDPSSKTHRIATLPAVQDLMASSRYPADRIKYVVGDVCRTLPQEAPDRIAILRLDTDWYESTKHELEALYDRISPGGVLIIDDYGYWEGARRAVDEFFAKRQRPLLLNRVDSSCRTAIVPGPSE